MQMLLVLLMLTRQMRHSFHLSWQYTHSRIFTAVHINIVTAVCSQAKLALVPHYGRFRAQYSAWDIQRWHPHVNIADDRAFDRDVTRHDKALTATATKPLFVLCATTCLACQNSNLSNSCNKGL